MLSPRDDELLATLCLKVRFLSLPLVARSWWGDSPSALRATQQHIADLVAAGWLREHRVVASVQLAFSAPEFIWDVGAPEPDHGKLAHRLFGRLDKRTERVAVFLATRQATGVFGGVAPSFDEKAQQSLSHDLHVAALYLHFRRIRPRDATDWLSDDLLKAEDPSQIRPDAVLLDHRGKPRRVIEFCGNYEPERYVKLYDYSQALKVPYELW